MIRMINAFCRREAAQKGALLSAVTLAVCTATAWADVPTARVVEVHQPTQIKSRQNNRFVQAGTRSALNSGSTVRTLKGGRAKIVFVNGTTIALRENSRLEILSSPTPHHPLVVRLSGNVAQAGVRPQGNTRIITSAATAEAKGFASTR